MKKFLQDLGLKQNNFVTKETKVFNICNFKN